MSDIKHEIVFPNSGLNHDDDIKWMQSGDSKLRRNILVGEDESGGLITNMLGATRTVDIADHELYLSRVYKVIGSYYNRLTRKVYYFIFSQPYEITTTSVTSSSSTSTTTTTTTEAPGGGIDIDYTSGDFQYDNMLLCYNEDSQTLDVIFRDSRNYFGLHYHYPMRDMVMIGNWLYFNPRVSEPKMIDVEMAYNYTNYDAYDPTLEYVYGQYVTFYGGLFRANQDVTFGETPSTDTDKWDRIGDSYQNETFLSDFDSEFRYAFNVIKRPPVSTPVFSYALDTTIHSNNVRGKVFRFSYRYKYFDNSYSVYSGYSDLTLSYGDEQWDGEILDDVQLNNYIMISLNLFSPALVKEVEVVFQEIGNSWCVCKKINRREQLELTNVNYDYDFYNNESYPIVDDSLVAKIEDSVPKLAQSQEIINKNILCYGGCTEGFVKVDKDLIDVTLTPELVDIDVVSGQAVPQVVLRDNIVNVDYRIWTDGIVYAWELNLTDALTWGLGVDDIYAMIINGHYYSFSLTLADLADVGTLADRIASGISETGVWENVIVDGLGQTWLWFMQSHNYPIVVQSVFFTPAVDAVQAMVKTTGFKTGAFHPFCIFYYDGAMRRWEAHTSKENVPGLGYAYDGTTVYIPMFNEYSPLPDDTANRWMVNWEVNHLPPVGAKYWRWGYAGNSLCTYFVQYIIKQMGNGVDEEAHMSIVEIEPLQTLKTTTNATYNQFPQSNIIPYEWQKGDRIRFITEGIADPSVPGTELGAFLDGVYDYEILKQDIDNHYIYIQEIDYVLLGIGQNSLVEIYCPNKSTSDSLRRYYEFGALMPIFEESDNIFVHGGETTDQSVSAGISAAGTFGAGDVYHIMRVPSKPICTAAGETTLGAIHESMWWSDFFNSEEWNIGKIGTETSFGERYLNIIRYSNPYFQNTQINGLSTFEALSYKELNDVFGKIVAIYEVGDTLKVYQERKASSILIGRTEYSDAEGNTSVAISTSILGAIRYSPSNYSTVFPESISRNNKYIYGFDIYNGVMWRDSVNGIFPISGRYATVEGDSDYKMATWFKNKARDLMVSGIDHVDVLSVWDEQFQNLHVIFIDYVLEDNNDVIVFHESSNRWICFQDLDQTPDSYNVMLELTYDIVKGFEGGLGYEFDEDTRFAIFNLLTTGNMSTGLNTITMSMSAPTPTGVSDGMPYNPLISFAMSAPEPGCHISYVRVDINLATWNADAYGESYASTINITTTENAAVLTSMPDWMTGKDHLLHTLMVGVSTIPDGEDILIYPKTQNTGGDRTGSMVFTDSYGNTATITVTQWGVPDVPEVILEVKSGETFTISDSTPSNTYVNVGHTDLHVAFKAHDLDSPGAVPLDTQVLKNGSHLMWTTVIGRNLYMTYNTITLPTPASASDVYLVILDEP